MTVLPLVFSCTPLLPRWWPLSSRRQAGPRRYAGWRLSPPTTRMTPCSRSTRPRSPTRLVLWQPPLPSPAGSAAASPSPSPTSAEPASALSPSYHDIICRPAPSPPRVVLDPVAQPPPPRCGRLRSVVVRDGGGPPSRSLGSGVVHGLPHRRHHDRPMPRLRDAARVPAHLRLGPRLPRHNRASPPNAEGWQDVLPRLPRGRACLPSRSCTASGRR
ncbi:hypothetical protein C2845_PM12G08060 [Panicum miliaceum]|uniref:Uncharacterized protein n=1 Tax=Panicum miliaceum TaxID=4540 RepID=A0A3L6QGP5_PANMI|nr:hypothetical protein C2845_PM12G08060 [Panicum miliaceum]